MKSQAMSQKLSQKVPELKAIIESQKNCVGDQDRLLVLDKLPIIQEFLARRQWLKSKIQKLNPREVVCIKSVIAIGQGDVVFSHFDDSEKSKSSFDSLLETLVEMENFYDTTGGIVGYHLSVVLLIIQNQYPPQDDHQENYYKPPGINIMDVYDVVDHAVRRCVEELPKLGEMYPIGGAGDRLSLVDEKSGTALPAAVLPFCGRSLLTGLIRDVQAKEFLYFRLMGQQITIPIALMTSHEKDNHAYIFSICENESWFGRPKDSFRFFIQPLVPVVSDEGQWVMQDPYRLTLKPGGHGVMWKKAIDEGVVDWFKKSGREKLLVRQINNPMAGTDYGILAFLGIGFQGDKSFGFASCRRVIKAAEGMNVLCEKKIGDEYAYCISNVEYTEFSKKGIEDVPADENSCYSAFPANTNILFVDIDAVTKAVDQCPIPGMIINMKSKFKHCTPTGKYVEVKGGRLESTMQNIADSITDRFPKKLLTTETFSLKTFVTFNRRRKTLSVTKNSYVEGKTIQGTPPGGFYEMLQNNREVLTEYCGMQLPDLQDENEYIQNGPSFIAEFHPALGPCWSIISQKIRGGTMAEGAEMQLEIAEVDFEEVDISGSLLVEAQSPMGNVDAEGDISYGYDCGKCELKNVKVRNAGIDRSANNTFWANDIQREESLKIVLQGNAEFFAEDVTFMGDQYIEVPDGVRLKVAEQDGELKYERVAIKKPTWSWRYSFDESDCIKLQKQ